MAKKESNFPTQFTIDALGLEVLNAYLLGEYANQTVTVSIGLDEPTEEKQ